MLICSLFLLVLTMALLASAMYTLETVEQTRLHRNIRQMDGGDGTEKRDSRRGSIPRGILPTDEKPVT